MNCPNGHDNPQGAAFCNQCGAAIATTPAETAPTSAINDRAENSPSRRQRTVVVGLVAGIVIIAGVVGGTAVLLNGDDDKGHDSPATAKAPKTFTVSGTITLSSDDVEVDGFNEAFDKCYDDPEDPGCVPLPAGQRCATITDGYGDIAEGAAIRVLDASGSVIAIGSLDSGATTVEIDTVNEDMSPCAFAFTIPDVPVVAKDAIYGLEISHRGVTNFREDEATSIALTLGD